MAAILLLLAGAAQASGPAFSATLGGSGQDFALAVTSDALGNTYVAGLTYSPDFPVTPQAFQTKFGQTCDAFVAKIGPDGKVIWSTYLGGILDDWAMGVAVDGEGNVLVAGYTRSADFPLVNPIESMYNQGDPNNDNYDAFVAKLDLTGSKLLYSTFLGGTGVDGANAIAVDAAGNAYVAVTGNAAGFPGIPNGPNQGGIIVSKLDPKGGLIYSFFHPNGTAAAIALNTAGSVYVAGTANPGVSGINQVFSTPGNGQALVFQVSPDGRKQRFGPGIGPVPFPFDSGAELLRLGGEHGLRIDQIMLANEQAWRSERVVTAPTNGAAGIIPAVAHDYRRFLNGDESGLVRYFLAAAGLAAALGGDNGQVEHAAEIGMEHNFGMTCDPIGGLVQIPCIERNAFGAVKAVNAARMSMEETGGHKVSLDQVIQTMYQTGLDMQTRYKETSLGGLAVSVIEC